MVADIKLAEIFVAEIETAEIVVADNSVAIKFVAVVVTVPQIMDALTNVAHRASKRLMILYVDSGFPSGIV